jgi:NodT family efflux transporter outer membrane factor (OMF) lipoprotein
MRAFVERTMMLNDRARCGHPRLVALAGALLLLGGCTVGPNYRRPTAPVPQTFKEQPPPGWKQAQPSEGVLRGKWWEIYKDPALNALEEQVSISNQNVLTAMAQYQEARYAVRVARSNLYPTVTASPSVTQTRTSTNLTPTSATAFIPGTRTVYSLPFDVTYQADIWGNIRRSVHGSSATAQASAADLENARLTFQAELAEFYFELHGLDGDEELLERTVVLYQQYLQLTKDRFELGVVSGADVAQAETQLYTAQAQLVDFGVQRAQFEHAIAILTGQPPAALTIPRMVLKSAPPPTPAGIPSMLLERRPDIAGAERRVAAANEQIGIAIAAYYPALTLSATGGFQGSSTNNFLTWPSRFWSVGPQLAQTLFSGGRLHAQVEEQRAAYDATVGTYRQAVLTAFQQVEDNLAALRILEQEAAVEDQAVRAAEDSLAISTEQYKAGITTYLQVIIAQTAALNAEKAAVDLLTRRLTASVLLIEALGGGWDASQLPAYSEIIATRK